MVQLCKKNCLEISYRGTVKSQRVQKSAKLLTEFKLVLHEVIIATFAEELKANSEGFPTSRHGEGAEHLQCHRTPNISSSSSTLINEQVNEK